MTRREALARHPLAIAGALLTTASAVVFIALLIAMLVGMLSNPYAGLVVFVAIPAVFVVGLLLIPLGMWLQRRKLARDPNAVADDWPVVDFRRAGVRRTALLIAALTAVNIVIILLAGYGGLHWMESPSLLRTGVSHADAAAVHGLAERGARAGRLCRVPHRRRSGGIRRTRSCPACGSSCMMPTNSYPRPIPPGAEMPPGAQAETCGSCHQPGRAVGDRIRVIREYADDEANSETMTVLQMHVSASASSAACHSLARRSRRSRRVRGDRCGAPDDPVRESDRREGQVKEYRRPGYDGADDQRGQAPDDGLHRLPQHGRASDLADARTGGRSGDRRRDGQPRASVRAA